MNVAILHYTAPPVVGGVESVLAQHANLISGAGHRVRVIAGRGEIRGKNIEFTRLPLVDSRHPDVLSAKTWLDIGQIPISFLTIREKLIAQLRTATHNVDVLIAHNVCSLHENLALTQALYHLNGSTGFPRLIVWHHDLAWTTPRYRGELHDDPPWDLLRTDWPGVTHVVGSTLRQRELSVLLGIAKDRIHLVPNGIDVAAFNKFEPQTLAWMSQLNLLNAAPILLLPVRITPRKNLELALKILAHLKKDFPAAVFIITGPPGAHNETNQDYFIRLLDLRAQLGLQGSAHFLAEFGHYFLPDKVIADFYRLADGLFLSSREEGFGIPLIEAALSHLPVFCTDLAPLRELGLVDARYFSPDDDPGKVADILAQFFHKSPVFQFAARTRQNYTWHQIYKDKIRPLLEQNPSQAAHDEGSR